MKFRPIIVFLVFILGVTMTMMPCIALGADGEAAETDAANTETNAETATETETTQATETENDAKEKPTIAKPKSLKATIKTSKKMVVSWKKVKGADSYEVLQKKGSGKYKKVKTVKATKKADKKGTYSVTTSGLKKNTKYTYAVRATDKVDGTTVKSSYTYTTKKMPKKLTLGMKDFYKTNAGKVIKFAKTKLTSKNRKYQYVSGASGPNRFDCSGYVYYVFKKTNVSTKKIKRTSAAGIYSQVKKYKIGRSISKAQPGDIIFCGSGSISHVGIYYGNGKMIHAANTRKDICISPVRYFKVKAIVRMPNM